MQQEADDSREYGGPDKTYFEATLRYDDEPLASSVAIRLKGHSSLLESREEGRAGPESPTTPPC